MGRRLSQFWRGMTMAAVLLFAAAQLVEQSHFHAESDALCAVCTHANGSDGSLPTAPSIEVQPFDALPTELQTSQAIVALPRFAKRPRAPPRFPI